MHNAYNLYTAACMFTCSRLHVEFCDSACRNKTQGVLLYRLSLTSQQHHNIYTEKKIGIEIERDREREREKERERDK